MEIVPFGKLDNSNLDEYYEGSIQIFGETVEIDLNFESESINNSMQTSISDLITNIEIMAKKAFEAISSDYDLDDDSETARFYLQHHLDQFNAEDTSKIFGSSDIDKNAYMSSLKLLRIGLYPEDEEENLIFDIQFPEEYTNYLMAVTFDNAGELSCISMDS